MQDWFSHLGQGYKGWDWGAGGIGWAIGGIPGLIVGSAGHLRGNYVTGPLGGLRHDNADDYKDAFEAAKERTQYWLDRWNKCCKKHEDEWVTDISNNRICGYVVAWWGLHFLKNAQMADTNWY
jgi:hypothetical protein